VAVGAAVGLGAAGFTPGFLPALRCASAYPYTVIHMAMAWYGYPYGGYGGGYAMAGYGYGSGYGYGGGTAMAAVTVWRRCYPYYR